jgi:hypothetical protein
MRRWVGAFLFIFVLILPFHFHPATENLQLSQECSCYYTGRTDLGPAPASVVVAPACEVTFLLAIGTEAPASVAVQSESARGPPFSL